MSHLTGKDYPELCEDCRRAIAAAAAMMVFLPDDDDDDDEAPCNFVYDSRLFCGGHECVNKPKEEMEK